MLSGQVKQVAFGEVIASSQHGILLVKTKNTRNTKQILGQINDIFSVSI